MKNALWRAISQSVGMSLHISNTISHGGSLPSQSKNTDILLFTHYRCPLWQNWFLRILFSTPNDQLFPRSLHLETVCLLLWNIVGQWFCCKFCSSNRSSLTSIKKIGHLCCMADSHSCLRCDVSLTDRLSLASRTGLCPCLMLDHLVCCSDGKKINHCN